MTDEKMAADGTAVERYAGNLTEEYRPRILMAPAEARALDDALRENMRAVLREGVDYGVIPGTGNKPALLKPGAEKLLQWFGFGHAMERTEIDTDDSGHRLGATYRCTVTKGLPDGRQAVIGMCEGYAGYDEDRFYTSAEQAEAKERANAARYKRSVNTSKFTSYRAPWNSVIKMAQKRAMVGAALQATSASSLFTQDIEDNEPVIPAAVAARDALRALPEQVQRDVAQWARQQRWSGADSWDASQWCEALIYAGMVRGAMPLTPPAEASGQAQETPETPTAGPARSWPDEALEQAATFATKEDGQKLWRETAARHAAGECTDDDRAAIEGLITARVADLEADIVEGVVIPGLAPEDPWHAKVESVASAEDAEAAIADVRASVKAKSLTTARGDQVIAAIRAREASLVAA